MSETFSYIGLLLGLTLVIAIVIWSICVGVLLLIDLKTDFLSAPGEAPNWFLIFLVIAIFCGPTIAMPTTYYAFARYWNYYPPIPKKDIRKQADNTQKELAELESSANKLRTILRDPKQLTLNQVEQTLTETLEFAEKLKTKTAENEAIISSLKQLVEEERAKAEESRRLAEQIQSLTREQLEAVKLLITQDARTESGKSFLLGIMVSFPIGISTSLLSSWIYRKWGAKTKAAISQEIK